MVRYDSCVLYPRAHLRGHIEPQHERAVRLILPGTPRGSRDPNALTCLSCEQDNLDD